MQIIYTDVLVIGGGLAGQRAAIERAHGLGGVDVVEAALDPGLDLRITGGQRGFFTAVYCGCWSA